MLNLPFGGLAFNAGATIQALSSAAAKLINFQIVSAYGTNLEGDPAIQPDLTNNRLLVEVPGVYWVFAQFGALLSAAAETIFQIRKSQLTILPELSDQTNANAISTTVTIMGWANLLKTDALAGIATFPAPTGTFTGGSGAPTGDMTTLDIMVKTVSGTPNLTIEWGTFGAIRMA